MPISSIAQKIRHYFDFLFDRFGFVQTAEVHFASFGNWVILLQSQDARIRYKEDRGEIFIEVSPQWSPPNWEAGPWFDLALIVAYLSQGKSVPQFKFEAIDMQLEQQADVFQTHCEAILGLFSRNNFRQHHAALENVRNDLDDAFWAEVSSPQ